MSGGFFRGTSADQDTRFSNKQAKLMKTQKFAAELEQLVDVTKVKMDVIKPWIATRVTDLLGFEDEVLINFIYGLLDSKEVNGKEVQIQLTGFMEKNTGKFMKELWTLLLSAQNNVSGVPQQLLDAKEEEIRKKKAETDFLANEIQKKREKENREVEQQRLKKMDDGAERVTNDALELNSKNMRSRAMRNHPADEEGTQKRNGVRGRSSDRHKSRSISRSPKRHWNSFSRGRLSHSPRRFSKSPRRRDRRDSFSPRRRSSYSRRSRSASVRKSISPTLRSPSQHSSPSPHRKSPQQSPSPMQQGRSPLPEHRRSPSPQRRNRSSSPVGHKGSPSPVRRSSPVRRRRSPSPVRRRRSPSPVRRRRSPSPVRRRRSPYSMRRRRSPSPGWRRRSPSPGRRRRSPSPVQRRRSPSPIRRRRSPSPRWRRRSPSLTRHRRSPSPARRRRSPSPARRRRSPSPSHYRRSPSPVRHHRSPLPVQHRRSQSPIRKHASPSSSPIRRFDRSLSPVPHRSKLPTRHRKSPSTPRSKSPPTPQRAPTHHSPSQRRSLSPYDPSSSSMEQGTPSPVKRKSAQHGRKSPIQSPREKIRNVQTSSPMSHDSRSLRSPKKDAREWNNSNSRTRALSSSLEKSPTPTESPLVIRSVNDDRNDRRLISPRSRAKEGRDGNHPTSKGEEEATYARDSGNLEARSSLKKSRNSSIVGKKKDSPGDASNKVSSPESEKHSRKAVPGTSDRQKSSSSHKEPSHVLEQPLSNLREVEKVVNSNRGDTDNSDSEEGHKRNTGSKEKKRHRRSERPETTSDSDNSYDTKLERKEARRRKKEERRLRKEKKRQRREERRRRKEERREEKSKSKNHSEAYSDDGKVAKGESYPSDGADESEHRKLETELRKKALESFNARKGTR